MKRLTKRGKKAKSPKSTKHLKFEYSDPDGPPLGAIRGLRYKVQYKRKKLASRLPTGPLKVQKGRF